MPLRKPVPTLRKLCLDYVSSHMDYWCDEGAFHDNPVSQLPVCILDDIVDNTMNLRPIHLNAVIHRHTKNLDFSDAPVCLVQRGIKLISNVCKNLTSLDLMGSTIDIENLKELANSISGVRILKLPLTAATDDVLTILGSNCVELRELDVRQCKITNIGIAALCDKNNASDGRKSGGRCRLINKLYIMGTSVTDYGAMMAIQNLPHLKHIDYENILEVLEVFYKLKDSVPLKLENIYQYDCQRALISNSTLAAATDLCNNITEVILVQLQNTDDWLIELGRFPQLKRLLLNSSHKNRVTFHKCVTPLLEKIGKNLKSLDLEDIEGINLWCVGMYCTQLKRLGLFCNVNYSTTLPFGLNNAGVFTNLRIFEIVSYSGVNIPACQLETLLSNCSFVKSLCFHKCQSLTDELFSRVRERNSFTELNSFNIFNCNFITKSSILSIINLSKNLENVYWHDCARIQSNDHQELLNFVLEENLDIVFENWLE